MNILIIGDSLEIIGGVPNYTKPLFFEMQKRRDNIYYLFSSAYLGNYSFFYRSRIVEVQKNVFEYKNSPLLSKNLKRPDIEITNSFIERELELFLIKFNIEIVHIHSMLGFPVKIYSVIKKLRIKLFITVHEYWWLCPHQVMVDFNNRICSGPHFMKKCSYCINLRIEKKSDFYVKTVYKLKTDFPLFFQLVMRIKQLKKSKGDDIDVKQNIDFLNLDYNSYSNMILEKLIYKRLRANIDELNISDKIIAVSQDVKKTLIEFGVRPEKVIVQHIGSLAAINGIEHSKKIEENSIIFGFIGGVGYYKGVHQLVEAFTLIPTELKLKARLCIYGKYSEGYYNSIMHDLIVDEIDKERITFFGKFSPADIPDITNKIDISVLPSLCADTAPQTIFESFSSGLPIIAPNIGGFPDFIEDGKNGLLYQAANVESLKDAMITIVKNPNLISKFVSNIPRCKTIQENVEELFELYREISK